MKKCPFCAEEIQDEAIICRFCHKKVKGIWFHRLVLLIIIVAVIAFALIHRVEMRNFIYKIRLFFRELDDIWRYLKEILRELKDGLVALKNSNKQFETINEMRQQTGMDKF